MALIRLSLATVLSTFSARCAKTALLRSTTVHVGRRSVVTNLVSSRYSSVFLRGGDRGETNDDFNCSSTATKRNVSSQTEYVKLSEPAPGSRKVIF